VLRKYDPLMNSKACDMIESGGLEKFPHLRQTAQRRQACRVRLWRGPTCPAAFLSPGK